LASLKYYVVKRLLEIIPLIFAVVIVNFIIIHVAPGDPASIMAGMEADAAYIESLRKKWGLDKPILDQLWIYLVNILQGDLGYSFRYNEPVISVILAKLPATLLLTVSGFLFALIFGIILGVLAARKPFSITDNVISALSLLLYSMPIFFTGIVLILLFSVYFRLFPIEGMYSISSLGVNQDFISRLLDILWHLFLPMLTVGAYQLALYSRLTRTSIIEELRKDYIITARSKGLPEHIIFFKHALKNAIIPVITVVGLHIGYLFTGSLIVESVFSWPGMGRLLYTSILTRDYPVLMGIFLISAIMIGLGNFLADILYAVVDPRVRYGE
jgi:peptide/nickel transport system permease protein